MINYKNTQEGYEADCTTVSYSWGRPAPHNCTRGSGVKPKVNRGDLNFTVQASAWLPPSSPEKIQTVSPTPFFSLKLGVTEDRLVFIGPVKSPPWPLLSWPETASGWEWARNHLTGLGGTPALSQLLFFPATQTQHSPRERQEQWAASV